MHKLILIVLFTLSVNTLAGQAFYRQSNTKGLKLEAGSITSCSIHGRKVGYTLNLNINHRWHINYFNLTAVPKDESSPESFRGAQVRYIINPQSRFSIGPALRMGYYNRYFLNVLPSVYSRYRVLDKLSIGGNMAYSDGFPYFDLELVFTLFEK